MVGRCRGDGQLRVQVLDRVEDTGRDGEGRMLGASGIDLWQQYDLLARPPCPALADADWVTTLREVRTRALHSHGVVGHVDEHVLPLQVAAATLNPDDIARSRGEREGVSGWQRREWWRERG